MATNDNSLQQIQNSVPPQRHLRKVPAIPFCSIPFSDEKNFTRKQVLEKIPCDFYGWRFAARHNLSTLEQYQRSSPTNWEIIKHILKRDDGLKILLHDGIPVETVGKIIAWLTNNVSKGEVTHLCSSCGPRFTLVENVYNGICEACKDKAMKTIDYEWPVFMFGRKGTLLPSSLH